MPDMHNNSSSDHHTSFAPLGTLGAS